MAEIIVELPEHTYEKNRAVAETIIDEAIYSTQHVCMHPIVLNRQTREFIIELLVQVLARVESVKETPPPPVSDEDLREIDPQEVFMIMKRYGPCTTDEIGRHLVVDGHSVLVALNKLQDEGTVEFKVGIWSFAEVKGTAAEPEAPNGQS